jgi:hypothetical protein
MAVYRSKGGSQGKICSRSKRNRKNSILRGNSMFHGFVEALGRDLEPGILAVLVLGLLSAGVLALLTCAQLIIHGVRRRFARSRKHRGRRRLTATTAHFDKQELVNPCK